MSFLSGYFKYIFILLFLITVHEIGHLLSASLLNYKIDKVIIYPFGGITKYNELLNTSMLKELIVLIGGPLLQLIVFIIITILYNNNFITDYNYNIIDTLHKALLYFNFLPIIPLDGSKLLNLILEKVFSYKTSNILSIIISCISIIMIIIFENTLIIVFLSIILIKSITNEVEFHKIKFNKFLLERYLYKFNFKKGKDINTIKKLKRNKTHNIITTNKIYNEKEYLEKIYKADY